MEEEEEKTNRKRTNLKEALHGKTSMGQSLGDAVPLLALGLSLRRLSFLFCLVVLSSLSLRLLSEHRCDPFFLLGTSG